MSAPPTRREAERVPATAGRPVPELRVPLLGIAVLVFVLIAGSRAHPGPGLHGRSLGVSVALVAFSVAILGVTFHRDRRSAVQLPLALVTALSSAALIALQRNGPGILGVFPAVSAAALRLPMRFSALVLAVTLAAVAGAAAVNGHWPLAGTLFDELGVIAFFSLSTFARRLRESNERNEHLLAELEGTREARARAAALAERQRLAREMHDVLAHSLSGLVLNLEGARLLADRDGADPEVAEAIERARRLAKAGLEEARGAIAMLRDEVLPGPERLEGLLAEYRDATGVLPSFEVTGREPDLGGDARLTLYRVAQEALTNIRKHARPARVEVRLTYEPHGARLVVEDVENPSDRPPPGEGSGYGLTGMRERAELIGGTLAAGPTGEGFRVELWVPS